jgi:hypothetical protein
LAGQLVHWVGLPLHVAQLEAQAAQVRSLVDVHAAF